MTNINEKEHKEQKYYNLMNVSRDKIYNFTIGEHDKGKKYAILQEKTIGFRGGDI